MQIPANRTNCHEGGSGDREPVIGAFVEALLRVPTYVYVCDGCTSEFEREQRISEDPIKECPNCGASKARRLITQGNFILKGRGWYADGYGSKKAPEDKPDKSKPGKDAQADKGESTKAGPGQSNASDTASTKASGESSSSKSGTGKSAA